MSYSPSIAVVSVYVFVGMSVTVYGKKVRIGQGEERLTYLRVHDLGSSTSIRD